MKKRYTINVAGYRMNVISDDAPEDIQEAVAALDRSVRTFCTRSRSLPLTEAAMLAGLDACAEKRRAQKRVRELEHELYDENGEVARMRRELAEIKKAILEMAEEDAAGTDAPAGNGEENEENGSDEGGKAGEKDADAANPDGIVVHSAIKGISISSPSSVKKWASLSKSRKRAS